MPRSDAGETGANGANSACGRGRRAPETTQCARNHSAAGRLGNRTAIGTVRFRAVPRSPKENAGGTSAGRRQSRLPLSVDRRRRWAAYRHGSRRPCLDRSGAARSASASAVIVVPSAESWHTVRASSSERSSWRKSAGSGGKGASVRGTNSSCSASLGRVQFLRRVESTRERWIHEATP